MWKLEQFSEITPEGKKRCRSCKKLMSVSRRHTKCDACLAKRRGVCVICNQIFPLTYVSRQTCSRECGQILSGITRRQGEAPKTKRKKAPRFLFGRQGAEA